MSHSPAGSLADRLPPEALYVMGALSQYCGAAIAVVLFDHMAAGTVAWLRVLGAGLIVTAVRRAWRRGWTRSMLATAGLFGAALASMNLTFYLALDRLPMGTAVAIEFIGPIAVAAWAARSARAVRSLLLATLGVLLLAGTSMDGAEALGVFWVLCAGVLWGVYILLGGRVARSGASIDGLGVGMLLGALLIAPFGAGGLGPAFDKPWLVVLVVGTSVLSNAIPYGIDQVVMARLPSDRVALLMTILPATAVVIGLVALGQVPEPVELAGIGLVMVALALRDRTGERPT